MQQPQTQQPMPSTNNFFNQVNPKNDQFDDVKKQFDISDDDLPF
jgi:single-stranded DNA-binding protein